MPTLARPISVPTGRAPHCAATEDGNPIYAVFLLRAALRLKSALLFAPPARLRKVAELHDRSRIHHPLLKEDLGSHTET